MENKKMNLTQIQSVSLEVLKYVSDICEKLGLRYFLAYGTLIGAVRHHDFIPWDDDIDIHMPRNDYEKLLEYFKNNKHEYIEVLNDDTAKNYPYIITRISDNRYRLNVINEKPYGLGIFIDIYPLDGVGNDKEKMINIVNNAKRLSSLIFLSTRKHFHIGTTKGILKIIIKFPAFIFAKIIGSKKLKTKINKYNNLYNYDESKFVSCLTWNGDGIKEVFEKKWFDEYEYMKFNKYQFRVPKYYDEILKKEYGNYMELPKEKDRIPHHLYDAYKK